MFRSARLTVLVAAAALAVLGAATTPAAAEVRSAAAQEAPSLGGSTRVTFDPAFSRSLLQAGVARFATPPARDRIALVPGGLTLATTYPIVGGTFDPTTMQGTIVQAGGNRYVNARNGRTVLVDQLVADPGTGLLTARVDGATDRTPLFQLDDSASTVTVDGSRVVVDGLTFTFTPLGARTLNAALGTTLFSEQTPLGVVRTTLDFAAAGAPAGTAVTVEQ